MWTCTQTLLCAWCLAQLDKGWGLNSQLINIEGLGIEAEWEEVAEEGSGDYVDASALLVVTAEPSFDGRKRAAAHYCSSWGGTSDLMQDASGFEVCASNMAEALARANSESLHLLARVTRRLAVPNETAWHTPANRDPGVVAGIFSMSQDFSGYCAPPLDAESRAITVAVVLNGQLRFRDHQHFRGFKEDLDNVNVFIATYAKYNALALLLTERSRIVHIDEAIVAASVSHRPLLQWLSLELALRQFRHEILSCCDVVVRSRTDIDHRLDYARLVPAGPGAVHCQSDVLFFATSSTFFTVFESMYRTSSEQYMNRVDDSAGPLYVPLAWENLLQSDLSNVKWWWLHLPVEVFGPGPLQTSSGMTRPRSPRELKLTAASSLAALGAMKPDAPCRQSTRASWNNHSELRIFNSETFIMYQVLSHGILCGIPHHQLAGCMQLHLFSDRSSFDWFVEGDGRKFWLDAREISAEELALAALSHARSVKGAASMLAEALVLLETDADSTDDLSRSIIGSEPGGGVLSIHVDGVEEQITWDPKVADPLVLRALAESFINRHPELIGGGCRAGNGGRDCRIDLIAGMLEDAA